MGKEYANCFLKTVCLNLGGQKGEKRIKELIFM